MKKIAFYLWILLGLAKVTAHAQVNPVAAPPAAGSTFVPAKPPPMIVQVNQVAPTVGGSPNLTPLLQMLIGGDGEDDTTTEGGFCIECAVRLKAQQNYKKQIQQGAFDNSTTGNACTDKILKAGRAEAACWQNHGAGGCGKPPASANYGEGCFKGNCGRAVAATLTRAGVNDGSKLGNAKDTGSALAAMGFKNVLNVGSTPENAPVGAILVYGPARRPGCAGAGSIFGHTEIKDFGGGFIYDGEAGRSIQAKMGADCRPLIGVYVAESVKCS